MSVKEELKALVQLQQKELELERIAGKIADIEAARTALKAEVAAAEAVVAKAEKDVEEARAAAKRLDIDLKTAEDKVSKFKDQMHAVKTNEQLWAIQEEIGHAEGEVGAVETKILEQLEVADSLTKVIDEKKAESAREKQRIDEELASQDTQESGLAAEREKIEASMAGTRALVSDDLLRKFESIKAVRAGVGVAEVYEELCMVCNTKVRPQLVVDAFNLDDVIQCENCKRIIYVAERLGLAGPQRTGAPVAEDSPVEAADVAASPAAASDAATADAVS
jgi:hypothetical protein